jgi:uncharacterized protein YjdB
MHHMRMGGPESAHTRVIPPWAFAVLLVAIPLCTGLLACGETGSSTEPNPVASVEITSAQCSFDALGGTLQLTAVARDEDGDPVTGVSFTWSSTDDAVVSVAGNAVTAQGNGTATVTATADSKSGTITCTVEQVGNQLAFNTEPGGGLAEEPLATQPTVEVRDANGHLVATDNSTVVTAAIGTNPSSGALSGTTSATAASGVASFTDLGIDKAGNGYTLTASASGLTSATSAAFNVAVNVNTVEVTPAAVTLTALGEQTTLTATAKSPSGAEVAGLTFDWSSSDELVATVSAAGEVTAVGNGTASITASFTTITSDPTAVTVQQEPTQLAFSTDPVGGKAEEPLGTQPVVEVQDANGNAVTIDNTTVVTAAIGTNPSSGTLSGTMSATAASGVASFTDLSIDKAGEDYTLTASASGLTGATSAAFDVDVNVHTIDCSPATLELHSLNQESTLTAVARSPSGAEQLGVTFDWSSSDELVATVSSAGVVKAVDNGTATVSASAEGKTGDCDVTVDQVAAGLTVSPHFKVLAVAEAVDATVAATDSLGNGIADPDVAATSRDAGVASVVVGPPVSVTGQAPGVTDVVVTSGSAMDSTRVAVVSQSGFAVLASNSSDGVRIDATSGSTLVLSFWMLRPTGGDGDLASISGTLQWDAAQLTYVSSAIVESSWSWFPNETNVDVGTLGFAAFSPTGTAADFELAQVTFTVSGAAGGSTLVTSTLTAAGNALGSDILDAMQVVGSVVRIQ